MLKNQSEQSIEQFQFQSLSFDFKKNQNKKAATERVSQNSMNASKTIDLIGYSSTKKSHTPNKCEKQNLIQKKKSYAQQIRQRNMQQLQCKKKKKINDQNQTSQIFQPNQNIKNMFSDNSKKLKPQPMSNAFKQSNRVLAPSCYKNYSKAKKTNTSRFQFDQNQNSKLLQPQKSSKKVSSNVKVNLFESNQGNSLSNNYYSKHISKSASRHVKQKKQLISLQSMYLNESIKLDQQQEFQANKSLMAYFTPGNDRQVSREDTHIQTSCFLWPNNIEPIQQLSVIERIEINSNLINLVIKPSIQHQDKNKQTQQQMKLLMKQNGTFKKQLAQFRKQNGVIRKQLDITKNYVKTLEEKAQQLMLNEKIYKQSFNLSDNSSAKEGKQNKCQTYQAYSLDGILQSTNQQLFGLKNQNKHLEMKVYMLQKKLFQQEQSNKKKMGVEINKWKQKCNQMRFELLRIKNQKNYSTMDWSISMDISRDQ